MSVGEYCNRGVVVVTKDESVRKAVELMRAHHVGDVVVVDKESGDPMPLGILTDRDIVLEVLAENVDIDTLNVGDIMSYDLIITDEDTSITNVIKIMQDKGVRRIPVVNKNGSLVGILTVDDVIEIIAEQLTDIVGLIFRESNYERMRRHA